VTNAERIRSLHASGKTKAEVIGEVGCSRQAYERAIKRGSKIGRPRKVAITIMQCKCPECGNEFEQVVR